MNSKNLPLLYIALGLLSFSLWTSWKQESQPAQVSQVEVSQTPTPVSMTTSSPEASAPSSLHSANLEIKTDVYNLKLDAQGN